MRSTTFTVRVNAAAKKRLERLAKSTGRSRSSLRPRQSTSTSTSTSGRLPASSSDRVSRSWRWSSARARQRLGHILGQHSRAADP